MNNNISAKTSNGLAVGTCMGISIASVLSWTNYLGQLGITFGGVYYIVG